MFRGPPEPGGGGGVSEDERTHEAATTIAPRRPSGSQPVWERGPAAGSWNNTRPNTTESHQIRFLLLGRLFRGTRTRHAPVISHVTEHQSNGRDVALAPAEADLQTLAGNTITQPPRPNSPMRLRERAEEGWRWRRRGGQGTQKAAFQTLFFLSGTQPRVSIVVYKFNFQPRRWSCMLQRWHATCFTAPCRSTLWLWHEQTAHLPHSPRY